MQEDPLGWLFGLDQFGIKFGLENIGALLARLGRPDRAFASVHVAGTNGKGSVTAMIEAGLRSAGHRSARYTSPHLVDVTERFVIDGRPVPKDALAAVLDGIRTTIEDLRADGTLEVQPTFFEVTTAAAFELFRRAGVTVAVLEVGLGGRLDATTVVSPVVTAITSIAFDHQLYLGSTLREIAAEKAGIIKPGVPVVVGAIDPEPLAVIEAVAAAKGAELLRTSPSDVEGLTIGLRGAHQAGNAAVAAGVLRLLDARGCRVPPSAIADGLARPDWPGRLDLRRLPDGREALLDAAHNPAGAAALASYLDGESLRSPLVFGAMRDKDVDAMFAALLPSVSRLIVTRASNARAADPAELARRARALAPSLPVAIVESPADALAEAWRHAPRIVVAGSIFLLGDVLAAWPAGASTR